MQMQDLRRLRQGEKEEKRKEKRKPKKESQEEEKKPKNQADITHPKPIPDRQKLQYTTTPRLSSALSNPDHRRHDKEQCNQDRRKAADTPLAAS